MLIIFPGCAEFPQPEKESDLTVIPEDKLAFYVITGSSQDDLNGKIYTDSIISFGKRFIGYDDIFSYDTVYFSFDLSGDAIEMINSLNIEYNNWCLPYAVVSNGEVIFGAYLYHPQSSCFPYWFYSTTVRAGDFMIYSPVWTEEPIKSDPRKDPRILKILEEENKIKTKKRTF
jgi:hypothetical protein